MLKDLKGDAALEAIGEVIEIVNRINADKKAASFFDLGLNRGMDIKEFQIYTNNRLMESLPRLLGSHNEDIKRLAVLCTGKSEDELESYSLPEWYTVLRDIQLDGCIHDFFDFAQKAETSSISAQETIEE